MKAVANLGGHLDYSITVIETIFGNTTDSWDEIALMCYQTHSYFRKMFDFKDLANKGTYRDIGLEKTTLIALKQEK